MLFFPCAAANLPDHDGPTGFTGQHKTGVSNLAYGGDPIFLNGSMYLCARADGDVTRFFSGSVAQASFYNEALNASSVMVGSNDFCLYEIPYVDGLLSGHLHSMASRNQHMVVMECLISMYALIAFVASTVQSCLSRAGPV